MSPRQRDDGHRRVDGECVADCPGCAGPSDNDTFCGDMHEFPAGSWVTCELAAGHSGWHWAAVERRGMTWPSIAVVPPSGCGEVCGFEACRSAGRCMG